MYVRVSVCDMHLVPNPQHICMVCWIHMGVQINAAGHVNARIHRPEEDVGCLPLSLASVFLEQVSIIEYLACFIS